MTWLFLLLAVLVVVATALALAGRWRPQGLDPGPPAAPRPAGEPVRFDVVLRGYRMDQVDAELARLRDQLLADAGEVGGPPAVGMPEPPPDRTIEP